MYVCIIGGLKLQLFSVAFTAVPKSDPYIEGNKHKYSPGELVELNCTSNSSDPEADLFWYINALPVSHTSLWSILLNFIQNIFYFNCVNIQPILQMLFFVIF